MKETTKTTKEKMKDFWNKYKTPIIVMTSAATGALLYKTIGCRHMVKLDFKANQKMLADQFNRIYDADTFKDLGFKLHGMTVKDLGEYGKELMDIYPEMPEDTVVTDVLVVTGVKNK